MSKVLFISDFHITPRQPLSRKDDYQNTLIMKLRSIKKVAIDNEVEHIIFLGDIFNTNQMTLAFFSKIFPVFKELSTVCQLHTVIGNHDILYNTTDTIQESPIQLLRTAGVFSNNKEVFLDTDVNISLFDYQDTVDTLTSIEKNNKHCILVGHYFYAVGFDDVKHTLTKEQCVSLGYDSYVLGHDHTVYQPIINNNYQVHRPGSLTRSTADNTQIKRENIQLLLFDSKMKVYSYINLPGVQPIKDIFIESKLLEKVTVSQISESMKDFLNALDFGEEEDIFKVLEAMEIPTDIKETIKEYLVAQGAIFGGSNT